MLLSDTVGFIDRLPHQLVAAFQGDARGSGRPPICSSTSSTPRRAIASGARTRCGRCSRRSAPSACRSLDVFNKIDLVDDDELGPAEGGASGRAVPVCARRDGPAASSSTAIAARLAMDAERVRLELDRAARSRSPAGRRSVPARARRQPRDRRHARVDRSGRAAPARGSLPSRARCRHDPRRRPVRGRLRSRCSPWRAASNRRRKRRRRPTSRRSIRTIRVPVIPAGAAASRRRFASGRTSRGGGCRRATSRGADARLRRAAEAVAELLSGRSRARLRVARRPRVQAGRRALPAALTQDDRYLPAWQGLVEAQLARRQHDAKRSPRSSASSRSIRSAKPQRRGWSCCGSGRCRSLIDTGRKARQAGRLDDAQASLERALALSPSSALILRELAVVETRARRARRGRGARAAGDPARRGRRRRARRARRRARGARAAARGGDAPTRGPPRSIRESGERRPRTLRGQGRHGGGAGGVPRHADGARRSRARRSPRSSACGSRRSSTGAQARDGGRDRRAHPLGGAVDSARDAGRRHGHLAQPHVSAGRDRPARRSRAGRQRSCCRSRVHGASGRPGEVAGGPAAVCRPVDRRTCYYRRGGAGRLGRAR